jgi:3-isopropylmalate dehydrogenase
VTRTPSALHLAVVAGDGIGPEVVAEGVRALETVCGDAVKVATTEYDLGARRWHATGETLPDSVLDELRGLDKVRGEWNLVTLAWNLKRMFALVPAT